MPFLGTLPPSSGVIHEKGAGVGTISQFPAGKIPATHLPCDGSQFDRNIFGELYEFLKNDRVPLIQPDYRIGDIKWFPKRPHIHPDFIPADGQLLNYSDYPDVKSVVNQDKVHQTTDSNFSNDAHYRGFWMTDLPDTFRVPDMNGKSLNSLGSVFVRGDGVNSNGNALIQGDAIRNITAKVNGGASSTFSQIFLTNTLGAFRADNDTFPAGNGNAIIGAAPQEEGRMNTLHFDASRVVPTANENRSLNLAGCWAVRVKMSTVFAIKTSGSVENEGYLDVAGLVQSNNELRQEISKLKNKPILSLSTNTNDSLSAGVLIPQYSTILNEGFEYNASTGTVITPKSGVYRVQFSYTTREGVPTPTSNSIAYLYVNGVRHQVMGNYYQTSATATSVITSSGEFMFRLNKGDTIRFEVAAANGTQIRMWSASQFNCEFIKE